MTKKFRVPKYLCKTNFVYMTNDRKIIERLLSGDNFIIYDKSIHCNDKGYLIVPALWVDTLTKAYDILRYIESHYEENLPYKINNILEIGCFDCDIKWL